MEVPVFRILKLIEVDDESSTDNLPSSIYGFSSDRVEVFVTKEHEERLTQLIVKSNFTSDVVGLTLSTLSVEILDCLNDVPVFSEWEQNQSFFIKMLFPESGDLWDLVGESFECGWSTVYIDDSNKNRFDDGRKSENICPSKLILYNCIELPAFETLQPSFQIVQDGNGQLADVTISVRKGCDVSFERDDHEDIYLTDGLRNLDWQFRRPYCYRIKCVPALPPYVTSNRHQEPDDYIVFTAVRLFQTFYEAFDLKDEPLVDKAIMSLGAVQYHLAATDITPRDMLHLLGMVGRGNLTIDDETPFDRAIKYFQQVCLMFRVQFLKIKFRL
jgi:hypothetical protein